MASPLFVVYMLWFSRGPAALSKSYNPHSGKLGKIDLKCSRRSPRKKYAGAVYPGISRAAALAAIFVVARFYLSGASCE
jgi:hypothetical protein